MALPRPRPTMTTREICGHDNVASLGGGVVGWAWRCGRGLGGGRASDGTMVRRGYLCGRELD